MKELEEINKIITKYDWKDAKHYKGTPHSYIVREYVKDSDYTKLYNYIKHNYVEERFFKTIFRYCYIGDYKYWIMTDDINQSRIINRCKRELSYGNN